MGVSQIHFHPKRYQLNNNKLYNWHRNFNSDKDKFRTLFSQGFYESIVINLYPNKASTLAAVILGFTTLSGTNPQIQTPNRYYEHPHPFYGGGTPPGKY